MSSDIVGCYAVWSCRWLSVILNNVLHSWKCKQYFLPNLIYTTTWYGVTDRIIQLTSINTMSNDIYQAGIKKRVFLKRRSSWETIKALMHLNSVEKQITSSFMILLPAAVHSPTSPSKKMLQSLGDSHLKAYNVLLCTPTSSLVVSRHYHQGQHILQILMNSIDTKYSDVCYILR